jgi:anti-sigma factor ChrR (cupin superfamily)
MNKIFFANWKNQPLQEVFPGIHAGQLWQGQTGAKAMIVKIDETGSEEIFVISGTFHDGKRSYPSGTFIHNPIGSSHVPQSDTGCLLFVFYPN